jgi:hypothetical protein
MHVFTKAYHAHNALATSVLHVVHAGAGENASAEMVCSTVKASTTSSSSQLTAPSTGYYCSYALLPAAAAVITRPVCKSSTTDFLLPCVHKLSKRSER